MILYSSDTASLASIKLQTDLQWADYVGVGYQQNTGLKHKNHHKPSVFFILVFTYLF